MAGVGFSGGKSGRNPEKSNSGICQKSEKTAAVPVPDAPDIEGTECLSLQIRVDVFVGGYFKRARTKRPSGKTGAFPGPGNFPPVRDLARRCSPAPECLLT